LSLNEKQKIESSIYKRFFVVFSKRLNESERSISVFCAHDQRRKEAPNVATSGKNRIIIIKYFTEYHRLIEISLVITRVLSQVTYDGFIRWIW